MSSTTHEAGHRSSLRVPLQRHAATSAITEHHRTRSVDRLPVVVALVDVFAITVTLAMAAFGHQRLPFTTLQQDGTVPLLWLAAPILLATWPFVIWLHGGYQVASLGAGPEEYARVLRSSVVVAAVLGMGCYFAQFELSRGFLLLVLVIGTALLPTGRLAIRTVVRRARRKGALLHRVLVVGGGTHVADVIDVLTRDRALGYRVVGALADIHQSDTTSADSLDTGSHRVQTVAGVPLLGPASDVVPVAREIDADVVFLAGGAVDSAAALREISWELEGSQSQVVLAPSVTDVARERLSVRPVGGLPLIHLDKPRSAAAVRWAKRSFDVIGASLLLVAFSPVFLFATFRIWMHDRGPITFEQERIGRDGVPFGCLKFRTMVLDAEARLEELHAELGIEPGMFYKFKDDPRITRPGRWLRRFSVDELPQLFNVLRGEMSLVGPRPQVAHEVALYDRVMARRLHVRPGMTGLWQVSGRSDLSVAEAMRLDLYYVENWSMVQDLIILLRTFRAVFGSRGAY